jgi:hypothetical protein
MHRFLLSCLPAWLLQSNLDHVVAMELWWRTAALQALAACVQGPLAQAPRAAQAPLHKRAAALLKPTLDVLTAHAALQVRCRSLGRGTACPVATCKILERQLAYCHLSWAMQEPARGKGGPAGMFAGAAALLQLRLLEAYAALPGPAAYAGEQEALTKLCMRTVRWALGLFGC